MMDNTDRAFREMQLQNLPKSTAAAVNELASYDWQSSTAREAYERIKDLLGREVLDQRFAGMKQALEGATEEDRAAVSEMLQDLNELLDKHRRGEDTDADFQEFMARHGQFFPENPQSVEELVDALAQRAAAAQRLLQSMSAEQREELMRLSAQAFGSPELMAQLGQLDANLRALRPGEDWTGSERFEGEEGLGLGDGTGVLQDLAELDELAEQLSQSYNGSTPGRPGPGRPRPPARAGRRRDGPHPRGDRAGHARRRLPAARGRRRPPAVPAGHAAARQVAAAGHRQAALRPAGAPGHARCRGGRGADRLQPPVGVRRRRTVGRHPDHHQRDPPHDRRRRRSAPRTAPRRGRHRGDGDGGAHAGRRRPAGGRVLLDGRRGTLGADETHRARPAPPRLHPVPRRPAAADHVRPLRAVHGHRRAHRPAGLPGAGHQPAPRAAAGRPVLPPAPVDAAGPPGGDRRRTHRAPAGRRRILVLRIRRTRRPSA